MVVGDTIFGSILSETMQAHTLRAPIIKEIQKHIKKPVVTLFTKYLHESDIEAFESLLIEKRKNIEEKGLALVLETPGGSGLTAERIICLANSYTNNNFVVIVPKKAKSAGTLIAMGSREIFMSKTAELGPVDPQVDYNGNYVSAHNVVETYKKILRQIKDSDSVSNIDALISQYSRFDPVQINEYENMIELSKKIAIKALKSGMFQGMEPKEIEQKIGIFIHPGQTNHHSRMIDGQMARECGLNITNIELNTRLWNSVYELYIRTKYTQNRENAITVIEDDNISFVGKSKE